MLIGAGPLLAIIRHLREQHLGMCNIYVQMPNYKGQCKVKPKVKDKVVLGRELRSPVVDSGTYLVEEATWEGVIGLQGHLSISCSCFLTISSPERWAFGFHVHLLRPNSLAKRDQAGDESNVPVTPGNSLLGPRVGLLSMTFQWLPDSTKHPRVLLVNLPC